MRNRSTTTPPGDPTHPHWPIMDNCWTFHAGASLVAVKGGVTGTLTGAGVNLSNTTGLVCSNQGHYITLASAVTLSPSYSIMWRSKTTGATLNSLIVSRSTPSVYLQMSTGSDPNTLFFRDISSFVFLANADSLLSSLVDYCITVTPTTTKLYSKLATDTTWALTATATRTGNAFTFDRILDGVFSQSNVGELHYLQTFTAELTATDLQQHDYPYKISTPDIAGPVVGTCSIPASGTYIEVPFTDESLPILPASIASAGGFSISASGGAAVVNSVLRVTPGNILRLSSRLFMPAEIVTLSYAGTAITDSASTPNALSPFTNRPVTNGSTATSGGGGGGGTPTTIAISARHTRTVGDVQPLVFPWFTTGATLTATRAIGVNPPVSIPSERLRFLYNADGEDIHALDYHPDDRPSVAGSVRYVISDGINKGQLILDLIEMTGTNGLHTITITVQDSSAGAIAGATVCVKNVDQTRTIGWGTTDSLGRIAFHLNAGTYKVIVDALSSQYNPLAVQTLVVTANGSVTYTLTTQSIDPPLSPGLATVRFLVLHSGTPLPNAKVTVWLEDDNPTVATALLSRQKTQGTTDVSGVVDLVMVHESAFTRGGVYHVEVSDSNGKRLHERRVTVPQVGTCYAEDLIDATS